MECPVFPGQNQGGQNHENTVVFSYRGKNSHCTKPTPAGFFVAQNKGDDVTGSGGLFWLCVGAFIVAIANAIQWFWQGMTDAHYKFISGNGSLYYMRLNLLLAALFFMTAVILCGE